ncbi:MAG: hypothetical protein IJT99_02535 [Clostridia bacterium]|nr:hypothetical protein [Clostridia bacterium]
MENTAEQYFVQTYIKKNRRDRLFFELSAEKRRYDGLSRFCHQAGELLDPAKIIAAGDDLERRTEFLRFVKQHDEACYVISPYYEMDGRTLLTKDAISLAAAFYDAVIIIGSTFAIIFGEPMKGGRDKYLLSE